MTPESPRLSTRGAFRVWTSDPGILGELCDFLTGLGYRSSACGPDVIAVAPRPSSGRAAMDKLRVSVTLWTLRHPGANVCFVAPERHWWAVAA